MKSPHKEPGIDILNCGSGHTEIRFTGENAMEVERAKRVIQDMLRRGYVLFIEGDDKALIRVEAFDPKKNVYIIGDGPLYAGDTQAAAPEETIEPPTPATKARRGPGRGKREIPVGGARATAIGRSAGG